MSRSMQWEVTVTKAHTADVFQLWRRSYVFVRVPSARAEKELCRQCLGKGKDRVQDNEPLSGSEWAQAESEHRPYPDVRSEKQRIHGANPPGHSREGRVPLRTCAATRRPTN